MNLVELAAAFRAEDWVIRTTHYRAGDGTPKVVCVQGGGGAHFTVYRCGLVGGGYKGSQYRKRFRPTDRIAHIVDRVRRWYAQNLLTGRRPGARAHVDRK